jgi:hypothetical protein
MRASAAGTRSILPLPAFERLTIMKLKIKKTDNVAETPAQYFARGGVVIVGRPRRAKDYRAATIRINAARNVQVNYTHSTIKG